MVFRKILSLGLFFLGIGLWLIVFACILFWITPALLLMYFAGWLSHARAWPELKTYNIWRWVRQEYFRFKLEEGAEHLIANQSGPVIYAIYPHGHFSITHVFFWALNPSFGDARAAIHSVIFWIPLFASFAKWIEAIHVTEKDMKDSLTKGISLYMCPGGIADIPNTGTTIKKRNGFIRIARECNAKVIPIWCPQERGYYSHWLPLGRFISAELPIMLIWGVWWCPFLPRRVPEGMHSRIIVGKAIDATDPEADEKFWAEMERIQHL